MTETHLSAENVKEAEIPIPNFWLIGKIMQILGEQLFMWHFKNI